MMTNKGGPSRAVGFALFGMATGIAMGLVESALRTAGSTLPPAPWPASNSFCTRRRLRSAAFSSAISTCSRTLVFCPSTRSLSFHGSRVQLRAGGPVYVSGQPASVRVLMDGDLIQIGRYSFRYKERHRS